MRRLRSLQNVPDFTGFFLRTGGVQLVLSNLQMENALLQRKRPWKSYSRFTFLDLKLFWNTLEAGMVLNWSFRNGRDPGKTGRSQGKS